VPWDAQVVLARLAAGATWRICLGIAFSRSREGWPSPCFEGVERVVANGRGRLAVDQATPGAVRRARRAIRSLSPVRGSWQGSPNKGD